MGLMEGVAEGRLNEKEQKEDPRVAACVILVNGGYPGL